MSTHSLKKVLFILKYHCPGGSYCSLYTCNKYDHILGYFSKTLKKVQNFYFMQIIHTQKEGQNILNIAKL